MSVHSRLGAPANQEAMQREIAERDMYIRDRERQVKGSSESVSGVVMGFMYLLGRNAIAPSIRG